MHHQLFDLSHPIKSEYSCSFSSIDTRPVVTFEEGDAHGISFITTRFDNLHSNVCTHIDFPGHLAAFGRKYPKPVGMYPIERFVGPVTILDFSWKLDEINGYFDTETGSLKLELRNDYDLGLFIAALDRLEISLEEFDNALSFFDAPLGGMKGILIYTGHASKWRYQKFQSWQYNYFFNPFFSPDVCKKITDRQLSFVGIDAFQLEHPIINFRGDELPLVVNPASRKLVYDKLLTLEGISNHIRLLGRDVLMYENLRIPSELKNKKVFFSGVPLNIRLEGVNDNALVRPYVIIE